MKQTIIFLILILTTDAAFSNIGPKTYECSTPMFLDMQGIERKLFPNDWLIQFMIDFDSEQMQEVSLIDPITSNAVFISKPALRDTYRSEVTYFYNDEEVDWESEKFVDLPGVSIGKAIGVKFSSTLETSVVIDVYYNEAYIKLRPNCSEHFPRGLFSDWCRGSIFMSARSICTEI